MAVQFGAGGAGRRPQGAVQLGGMHRARFFDHDAAVVQIGADLLPLALARHDAHRARPVAEPVDLSP